jgi:tetratricopeptide (TPR) repeat protein
MIVEQYYEILGLKLNASPQEVKQAHRKLAKTWHPDKFLDNPPLKELAEQKIRQINQAYEALKSYRPSFELLDNTSAITIERNDPVFYYQQGVIKDKQGEMVEAIIEFSRAIYLNPRFIKAYQYRGFLLDLLGSKDAARSDFELVDALYEEIFAALLESF